MNGVGRFARNNGGEGSNVGFLHAADAAEVLYKAIAGESANPWNGEQLRIAVAHLAALAMVADGKAVRLVTDTLHEMEYG